MIRHLWLRLTLIFRRPGPNPKTHPALHFQREIDRECQG